MNKRDQGCQHRITLTHGGNRFLNSISYSAEPHTCTNKRKKAIRSMYEKRAENNKETVKVQTLTWLQNKKENTEDRIEQTDIKQTNRSTERHKESLKTSIEDKNEQRNIETEEWRDPLPPLPILAIVTQ